MSPQKHTHSLTINILLWFTDDPEQDENIDGDPFNTLFVTHLSPEATETDLMSEFELYGQIKKVTPCPGLHLAGLSIPILTCFDG